MRRQNPQQQQTTDNTAQANAPLTGGQNYNSVPVNQTVAPLQTNQSPVMKQVRFFQPSMKTQELKELIRQRIIKQMPLLKHYPDMPVIEDFIIQTFDELAYKMSDQQDFIVEQLEEIMTKFHGHYMTKLCKQLKEENKNLQDQVDSTHPPQLQQTQNVAQEEEKSQQNSDTSNPFAKKKQDAIQNGVDKINQELESEVFQKDEDIYQAHQKIKLLEQLVQDKTKIEEDLRRKLQFAEEDHSKIKQSLGTMVMKSQLEFIKKSKIDLEKQVKSLTLEKQSHDMEIQRMKNDMMKLQNLLNQQQQAQSQQIQSVIDKTSLTEEHEKQLEQLTKNLEDLNKQIKEKDLIISNFQAQEQSHNKQQKELTQDIESSVHIYENELRTVRETNHSLTLKNKELEDQIQQDEVMIQKITEKEIQYHQVIENIQKENVKLTNQIKESEKVFQQYQVQIDQARNMLRDQQDQLIKQQSRVQSVNAQVQTDIQEQNSLKQADNEQNYLSQSEIGNYSQTISPRYVDGSLLMDNLAMNHSPRDARSGVNLRKIEEQEKQLEQDMNFSMNLLNSVKNSNHGSVERMKSNYNSNLSVKRGSSLPSNGKKNNEPHSSSQSQQDQMQQKDTYHTFAATGSNPRHTNSKSIQYMQIDLQQLKEQIYSKLKFLQTKMSHSAKHQNEQDLIYGVFKIQADNLPEFIKNEINQLQKISNIVNEVILQSEDNFNKIHEQKIKDQLFQIMDGKQHQLSADSNLEEIIDKLNIIFYQVKEENYGYLQRIEQVYEPQISQLLQENKQLKNNDYQPSNQSVLLENQQLKQDIKKIQHQQNVIVNSEQHNSMQLQAMIHQLSLENESLLLKAQTLSDNLKLLAQELDVMKETKEKIERENDYLRQQQNLANYQMSSSAGFSQTIVGSNSIDHRLINDSDQKTVKKNHSLSREHYPRLKLIGTEIEARNMATIKQTDDVEELRNKSANIQEQAQNNLYKRNHPLATKERNHSQNFTSSHKQLLIVDKYSYENQDLTKKRINKFSSFNENPFSSNDDISRNKTEDNEKLNQLIQEYKMENSKCTQKITELKDKLQNTKYKFYIDRSTVKDVYQLHTNLAQNYSLKPQNYSQVNNSSNNTPFSNGVSNNRPANGGFISKTQSMTNDYLLFNGSGNGSINQPQMFNNGSSTTGVTGSKIHSSNYNQSSLSHGSSIQGTQKNSDRYQQLSQVNGNFNGAAQNSANQNHLLKSQNYGNGQKNGGGSYSQKNYHQRVISNNNHFNNE
eukprot:403354982